VVSSTFEASRHQQTDDAQSTDAALRTGIADERARGFATGLGAERLLNHVCERGADLSKLDLAAAIGQKTVMPNLHNIMGSDTLIIGRL